MEFSHKDVCVSKPIPPCRDDEYEEVAWGIEKIGEGFKKLTINRPKVKDSLVRFVNFEIVIFSLCTTLHFHKCVELVIVEQTLL